MKLFGIKAYMERSEPLKQNNSSDDPSKHLLNSSNVTNKLQFIKKKKKLHKTIKAVKLLPTLIKVFQTCLEDGDNRDSWNEHETKEKTSSLKSDESKYICFTLLLRCQ